MTIVIDASVALKWVMAEDGSAAAVALRSSGELAEPAIWLTEAANGLWKYVARRELDIPEAQERLVQLRSAPIVTNAVDDDIEALARQACGQLSGIDDLVVREFCLPSGAQVAGADRADNLGGA